ncbi:chaperone NapD [Rhizobium sp. GCM10022189]|uniref:chaperone NapD n=1 Tax=Rhizobium sp. GCM10022189 TaxID=3252654 RepID=UPI00361D2534
MPDGCHHISSAVVLTRPELTGEIAARLAGLSGVEVHATAPGKIVVVIEGPHSAALGERLIGISGMDGVLAAHMVFEQALDTEETGDDGRTDAA